MRRRKTKTKGKLIYSGNYEASYLYHKSKEQNIERRGQIQQIAKFELN